MCCERHRDSCAAARARRSSTPPTSIDAAGRRVEPADQVEQRRLAGAGRAHQRQELALRDVEVDALQHVDALAAAGEVLVDVADREPVGMSLIWSRSLASCTTIAPCRESGGGETTTRSPALRPGDHFDASPSVPPVLTARRSTRSPATTNT